MSGVEVRTNLPEFKSRLREIGQHFEKRAVRGAIRSAAQSFVAPARRLAPVQKPPVRKGRVPGTLRRAIYLARPKDQKRGAERYFVGVRSGSKEAAKGRDAYYWRWVEMGHIARGPGQRLRGGVRSRALQRGRLKASGGRWVEPRPFLAPAFAAGRERALQVFYTRLTTLVARYSDAGNKGPL